ncbi:MAG: DinB family protein [Chitinophagaceae bacterium]|nr:DinB family protein [Chitinophagaceae bacterium]
MLKRTMGLSLLGLLVISGLAGRLTNNSLTKPERKKALTMMKETRADLVEQVSGLRLSQYKFRPAGKKKNIQDHIMHIAGTEQRLWDLLEQAMKKPSSQASRSQVEINDEDLIKLAEDRSADGIAYDPFLDIRKKYSGWNAALEDFKKSRNQHIRYLRTSTEDLRNHIVKLSFGSIDCYQLCLLIAAHSNRHTEDIRQIMNDTSFPK